MLRRSHTVRAKFGFGKERKQTDSVVCYEILGGALSVTESFLFPPFQPPPHSLLDFILSHRSLPVGRVRKSSWGKDPSVQVTVAWPMTAAPTVDWNEKPSVVESVLPRGKTALCDDFLANAGNSFALHTERETFLTAAHEPHIFTLAHAHYLFIGSLSLLMRSNFGG